MTTIRKIVIDRRRSKARTHVLAHQNWLYVTFSLSILLRGMSHTLVEHIKIPPEGTEKHHDRRQLKKTHFLPILVLYFDYTIRQIS